MIDELLVHAGDCKTGSTSIQQVLVRGAWAAEGWSVCYPTEADHNFVAHTLTRPWEFKYRDERFELLAAAYRKSDARLGILSAEHLEFTDPQVFRDALEQYMPEMLDRVRVLTYVRPHAERMLSDFAERSKVGDFSGSMDDFLKFTLDTKFLEYTDRINRWKEVFDGRVTIRPMIRSLLKEQDVVKDFFADAMPGADVTFTPMNEYGSNSSLPLEQLVYVRAMHNVIRKLAGEFDTVDQRHHMGWHMGQLMHQHRDGVTTKLRLHKSIVQVLQETYAEDAARFDQEHLGGGSHMADRLAAAMDEAVDTPQSLLPRDHFSPRALSLMRVHAELMMRVMHEAPIDRFGWLVGSPDQNTLRREIRERVERQDW